MFNSEIKARFIKDYTGSLNTAKVAQTIFNAIEKFELEWGADICTKSTQEAQKAANSVLGLRSRGKWMQLTILKEYGKWCLAMHIPNACDGLLHINADTLEKIKKHMVSNPLHLQNYLDSFLDPEDEETTDNVLRCYFWMAYSGVKEEDALFINGDNVDLNKMIIINNDMVFPIYREAFKTFYNVVNLDDFAYKHPNYTNIIRRKRVCGKSIMRGIKTGWDTEGIRNKMCKENLKAIRSGKTELKLSYQRVRLSGIFYRTYEMERAGIPVSFSEEVALWMKGKEYANAKFERNRIEYELKEDYTRWKLVFSV